MAVLFLKGSVGTGSSSKGKPHNDPEDVLNVRDRLVELGYTWVTGISNAKNKDFVHAIKLFQCIIKGRSKMDSGDGRVSWQGNTHRWLAARNAPGWVSIEGKSGIGWSVTTDLAYGKRKNSFTTTWMLDRIRWAGLEYASLVWLLGVVTPPMWIRDCSPAKGGDALGHKSHETGLDVDMRLPLLPPNEKKWDRLQGKEYDKKFHLDAAEFQLRAINNQMNARYVWFNDPRLLAKGICKFQKNHGNHYHIRIKPPVISDGIYK